MKRILVTGSRNWRNFDIVGIALASAIEDEMNTVIVHGDCPTGADRFADEWSKVIGCGVERHPADWDTHGRAAGPIRNQEMVDLGADVVLAFLHDDSRGTKDCVRRAKEAGIPVIPYGEEA